MQSGRKLEEQRGQALYFLGALFPPVVNQIVKYTHQCYPFGVFLPNGTRLYHLVLFAAGPKMAESPGCHLPRQSTSDGDNKSYGRF